MSDQKTLTYHEQLYIEYTLRLRNILKTLPTFAREYFRAIEPRTSAKTRISYSYDIRVFFQFLIDNNPIYKDYQTNQFQISDIENLQSIDIEEYQEYLKVYRNAEDKQVLNKEKGISRKMSALRSFFQYFYKRQVISNNPTLLVDMPKLHEKAIIRMDLDEVSRLLEYIEHCGDTLTGQKKVYHEKTKYRDLAIVTLLLGTGVRVSECVGLDLDHVDFKQSSIKVTRKGGNEAIIYFGDEVEEALMNYITIVRTQTEALSGHERALFLSTQKRRMGVQAVENMVKKYAQVVTPNKHITPHKLRSTYGTALYQETSDIYLVAEVLGHKDVNTTKKHYAQIDESRMRKAANAVKLRENL